MMTTRRAFLKSILAAGVAPYVITAAGVLMPVRQIISPATFPDGVSGWIRLIRHDDITTIYMSDNLQPGGDFKDWKRVGVRQI